MLKTRDVSIDDNLVVTLQQLPATAAADAMYRVTRAFGPAAGQLTSALEGEEIDLRAIPEAVRLLFASLTPSEFRELRELFLQEATFLQSETADMKAGTGALLGKISGTKLTHFDMLFAGKVFKIFPLMWAALELNFGFSVAASLNVEDVKERVAAAILKRVSKGSTPKSRSVGPATDS